MRWRVVAIGLAFAIQGWADGARAPADASHGKQIFETICAHCHYLSDETSPVGTPGLKHVTKRRSEDWLHQWLQNPAAFAKKDETAKKLIQSNPTGLTMPSYPEMQDEQNRRDVIEFLKSIAND